MLGEIIGESIAYLILNFVGGTLRWIYSSIWRTLFNKPKFKYSEYLKGPEESDYYDSVHGCFNIIIGLGFILLVLSFFI